MLSTKAKIRIARVLNKAIVGARSMLGKSSIIEARRFGANWRLDLNEGIDLAIYLGMYQNLSRRTTNNWLHPGSLAVDIGANIGAHSLRIAQQIGADGRVVAIEPTEYAFAKLNTNARLNPDLASRLVLVQAALTDGTERGRDDEFYSRWPLRTNGHQRHAQHLGQLESARGARFIALDDLLDELRAAGCIGGPATFVKLDVDGNELNVLRGGRKMLAKERPVILIEIAPHVQDEVPHRFEDLLGTLESFGYRLEDQNSGQLLPMSAADFRNIITKGASIDAVARPA